MTDWITTVRGWLRPLRSRDDPWAPEDAWTLSESARLTIPEWNGVTDPLRPVLFAAVRRHVPEGIEVATQGRRVVARTPFCAITFQDGYTPWEHDLACYVYARSRTGAPGVLASLGMIAVVGEVAYDDRIAATDARGLEDAIDRAFRVLDTVAPTLLTDPEAVHALAERLSARWGDALSLRWLTR